MQMVSRPQQFDVLVMGNLYGDLVSDLGAGIVGGISATAGINVGDGVRVYESFHGGTRDASRRATAPTRCRCCCRPSTCWNRSAKRPPRHRILRAVETVLAEGQVRTPDLGGDGTTHDMADAVVAALNSGQ